MILLLHGQQKGFLGFIPQDQKQFIEDLKQVVANHRRQQQAAAAAQQQQGGGAANMQQQQQMQQQMGQQMGQQQPQMPTSTGAGPPGMKITMGNMLMAGGTMTTAGGEKFSACLSSSFR